jgi:leader peptidase (prepilin peptidase) / N-methyltransferase
MGESEAVVSSPWLLAFAAGFGAVMGSFFNVCIARVPLRQSIVRPGSRCMSCGTPVRPADNLPIVSYLWLRGRCRSCGVPFSARYPVVELITAALSLALWWKLVVVPSGELPAIRLARYAHYFAFAGVLEVLSFIDLETQLLPDVITLPAIAVLYLSGFGAHDAGWLERLIGAAAGYVFFRLIADIYYYVLKREGLGLGDGKLLAVIGAVLGWKALPFVVFVGSLLGALVTIPVALAGHLPSADPPRPLRRLQIPFGPYLALAALAYLFAGGALATWWLSVT